MLQACATGTSEPAWPAKLERLSHFGFKRIVSGAFNLDVIGSTCTASSVGTAPSTQGLTLVHFLVQPETSLVTEPMITQRIPQGCRSRPRPRPRPHLRPRPRPRHRLRPRPTTRDLRCERETGDAMMAPESALPWATRLQ